MAQPVQLLLAILVLVTTAQLHAQESRPTGEIVRGGGVTAEAFSSSVDSSGNTELAERNFPSSEMRSDPFVRPAAASLPATAATTSGGRKPIPLAARAPGERKSPAKLALGKPADSLVTVGGSLCVVLALFFGLAWITRRGLPQNLGPLPGEVIEVLGKAPLVKGQDLQLVRIGAKLLLICVTPSACETLTEITDDNEVERLSAICRRNHPSSMTAAFNQVLSGIGREPASGFAGAPRTGSERRGGRTHA